MIVIAIFYLVFILVFIGWIMVSRFELSAKLARRYNNTIFPKSRLSYVIIGGLHRLCLDGKLVKVTAPNSHGIYEITNLRIIHSINLSYEKLEHIREYGPSDLRELLTHEHQNIIEYIPLDVHIHQKPLFGNKVIDKRELIIKKLTSKMKP